MYAQVNNHARGAAVTELLVVLLALAPISLGALQLALVYNAKTTLNYAAFEAARAGAVANARRAPMQAALARSLIPLYGGGSDASSLIQSQVKAFADVQLPVVPNSNVGSGTRIDILSPSEQAFADFGVDIDGQRQLPNDNLKYRPRTIGARSGVNIQDANLLKIKVTYGYKLFVPVVNRLVARTLELADPANAAYYRADPPRLPIVATATVRMHTPAFPDNNASAPGGTVPPGGGGGGTLPPPQGEPGQEGDGDSGGGDGTGGSNGGGTGDAGGGNGTQQPPDDQANGDPQSCPGSDSAAQGTQVAGLGVGNPVHVVTGNKYQREIDISALPGTLGLEFVRHYNSREILVSNLGRNWRHSYNVTLSAPDDMTRIVHQADGRAIYFRRSDPAVSTFMPAAYSDGFLTHDGAWHTWSWRDGRKLIFDGENRLTHVRSATGETVALTYDRAGKLRQVTDPQRRTLAFNYYANGRIRQVLDPAGRTIAYAYDENGNLTTVTYADGTKRQYHYEDPNDPHNLTGITDARGVRFATYAYDKADRAILSTHAGGVGRVTLSYEPDRTVVTNSQGMKSIYRTATIQGIPIVTAVEGPGCGACGAGDIRYRYNEQLQLTEIATRDGKRIRRAYDAKGRLIEEAETAGTQKQYWTKYGYNDGDVRPHRITRPSIVRGKELITEIEYDTSGLPRTVTERGWRPAIVATERPAAIERRSILRYRAVNGLTLLAEIDGPLPNGPTESPDDSDITRFEYDREGSQIVGVMAPGGRHTKLRYDRYGRILSSVPDSGMTVTYAYDARGNLLHIGSAGVVRSFQYDSEGRVVEAGIGVADSYVPRARFGYDAAGRNTWIAHHLGILERFRYDTESNLLEAMTQSASFTQRESYQYDDLGRLVSKTGANGATRRLAYDTRGRVNALTDPLGLTKRYEYDALGNLVKVTEAANTPHPARVRFAHDTAGRTLAVVGPNGATTRYLTDDFGRRVAVISPDSGTTVVTYDVADRPVEAVDALGNRTTYTYDPAGRLLDQTVHAANAGTVTTTRYRWEGPHLAAVEHPNQRERNAYDAHGRLAHKTVTLVLDNGNAATYVTRYVYDEKTGRLTSQTLPDGTALHYQTNGQGQLVALERRGRPLSLAQTLVKDIERDLVGLRRFTYGNGIEAHYQRSREGTLARIVHRLPQTSQRRPLTAGLDPLDWLGVPAAHAMEPRRGTTTAKLPGAIGLPHESNALIDHRYLWDVAGNLRHVQRHLPGKGPLVRQDYAYDGFDRLTIAVERAAAAPHPQTAGAASPSPSLSLSLSRYFYDSSGNRRLAQEDIAEPSQLDQTIKASYAPQSNRAIRFTETNGQHNADAIHHDALGRPVQTGNHTYTWDANGKLSAVNTPKGLTASYRYNHRGLRVAKTVMANGRSHTTYYLYERRQPIAELNEAGKIIRQYVYLAGRPVAVIDSPAGKALSSNGGEGLGDWLVGLGSASKQLLGLKSERIVYLHLNHLGAPEAATDETAEPIWRARYSPYGKIILATASEGRSRDEDFALNLRLPGQYEDSETGLYYNDHRYYDPAQGRYLTPDPLGLRAGINSYSYVANNPLKYVDPTGLILFAFDGTWSDRNAVLTNVELFRRLYDQDSEGPAYYVEGVGTGTISDPVRGGVLGVGVRNQITRQLANLDSYLQAGAPGTAAGRPVMIDIIGFSRGATAGRGFANDVLSRRDQGYYQNRYGRCVVIRFMGLFDTVAQSIEGVDLRIRPEVMYAAQAVALNEHRQLFPLESIEYDHSFPGSGAPIVDGMSPGERIERGFIGAHSDIGGGYCGTNLQNCAEGDLYKVALSWMVTQARFAGVNMNSLSNELRTISRPILHDESSRKLGNASDDPLGLPEDRVINYPNDSNYNGLPTIYQDSMDLFGLTTAGTEQFLNRYSTPRGAGINRNRVAEVQMTGPQGYAAWLRANYFIQVQ